MAVLLSLSTVPLKDNKKGIENFNDKLLKFYLVEYFMNNAEGSKWKFYRFLDVKFHLYEMNTPVGKANELPIHFKEGSK